MDEEEPFLDDGEESPTTSSVFTKSSIVATGAKPPVSDKSFEGVEPVLDPTHNIYVQGPFVEERANIFLEEGEEAPPATKRVALNTPRTGLLRCDQCQRTNTVMAASQNEAIEMQCACGKVYRVLLDSRKFDRKFANLPGFYVDQTDDTKTGIIVVENISFGGLKFRTTSAQNVAYDDLLYVQFTLDDEAQTLIWEKVRVHYVHHDTVGVEFMDLDKFNKNLASYLMC